MDPIAGSRKPVGRDRSTALQGLIMAPKRVPNEEKKSDVGLFRADMLTAGPARSLRSLFADLRSVNHGQIFGEDPQRNTQGTRLMMDGSIGHGSWELYRLGSDLYIITGDSTYDSTSRTEILTGEGLLEFHLRLSGSLVLSVPGAASPVVVTGPCMMMLHQPPGIDVPERVVPESRDTGVSLYCRPQYLSDLAERNGIARWSGFDEIGRLGPVGVWYRQEPLSPTLLHIANSLLRNPYQGGVRLLRAEATALELLCEILTRSMSAAREAEPVLSESEARQLDAARRLLATRLDTSLRTRDVARAVGMSQTKLKGAFKTRFDITVFDYGLECRMRHALELLRSRRIPVGQVARAVGYVHQTSFAAAFQQFFGFLPNHARKNMH